MTGSKWNVLFHATVSCKSPSLKTMHCGGPLARRLKVGAVELRERFLPGDFPGVLVSCESPNFGYRGPQPAAEPRPSRDRA
jgi:hypothetical protein